MKAYELSVLLLLSSLLASVCGYGVMMGLDDQLNMLIPRGKRSGVETTVSDSDGTYTPLFVGDQGGLMEADRIEKLPGQPDGVEFQQYGGYVTVDPKTGRALFYYFTEATKESETKPLVLWLNGGPGCSSLGAGAMMELGPFRVNSDGRTLSRNPYAWNEAANIIYLESPAGVGFSYSNTTSDYNLSGDTRTAIDSYTFLVNWLERFPQYKNRDFYITGESYAGHYVPQLAHTILVNNNITNQTIINLRGIAIGNALIDDEMTLKGAYDFYWSHALISDEIHQGITLNCNFSSATEPSDLCEAYRDRALDYIGNIFPYDIYVPWCNASSPTRTITGFDPCSSYYIDSYLNLPQVQVAFHANVTSLPYPWSQCSSVGRHWTDRPSTILPIIKQLMKNNIRVWIYSGDTDGVIPVTSSRYSINTLNLEVNTSWYPWYTQEEVGGYAVGYQNLAFVTVRGSGHFVPSYQPARAFILFMSFLDGYLPPKFMKS